MIALRFPKIDNDSKEAPVQVSLDIEKDRVYATIAASMLDFLGEVLVESKPGEGFRPVMTIKDIALRIKKLAEDGEWVYPPEDFHRDGEAVKRAFRAADVDFVLDNYIRSIDVFFVFILLFSAPRAITRDTVILSLLHHRQRVLLPCHRGGWRCPMAPVPAVCRWRRCRPNHAQLCKPSHPIGPELPVGACSETSRHPCRLRDPILPPSPLGCPTRFTTIASSMDPQIFNETILHVLTVHREIRA